jgi:small subunit ribosomal protein S20
LFSVAKLASPVDHPGGVNGKAEQFTGLGSKQPANFCCRYSVDKRGQNEHITRFNFPAFPNNIFSLGVINLANSAQARKRARQADKSRALNASQRSEFRTSVKKVVYAIDAGDKNKAAENYKLAVPVIDSMAGKGIISKNKAARHKSRLNARIKALA